MNLTKGITTSIIGFITLEHALRIKIFEKYSNLDLLISCIAAK